MSEQPEKPVEKQKEVKSDEELIGQVISAVRRRIECGEMQEPAEIKELTTLVGSVGEAAAQIHLENKEILPHPDSECALLGEYLKLAMRHGRIRHPLETFAIDEYEGGALRFQYEPDFLVITKEKRGNQSRLLISGSVEVKACKTKGDVERAHRWVTFWKEHPALTGEDWDEKTMLEQIKRKTGTSRQRQINGVRSALAELANDLNKLSQKERDNLFEATGVHFPYPIQVAEDFKLWYVTTKDDKNPVPEGTVHVRLPLTYEDLVDKVGGHYIEQKRLDGLKKWGAKGGARAETMTRKAAIAAETIVQPALEAAFPQWLKKGPPSNEELLQLIAGRPVGKEANQIKLEPKYPNLWTKTLCGVAHGMRRAKFRAIGKGGWDETWWKDNSTELLKNPRQCGVTGSMSNEETQKCRRFIDEHFSQLTTPQRATLFLFISKLHSSRGALKSQGIEPGEQTITDGLVKLEKQSGELSG